MFMGPDPMIRSNELQSGERKSDLRESIGHFLLDTHDATTVWSNPPDELGCGMEGD